MVNFLALLGWSPGTNQGIFSREELVWAFALDGISGSSAVFNPENLDGFNQQHLARLAPAELARRVKPYLEGVGLWRDEYLDARHAWLFAVLELLKPRAKRLGDFVAQGRFFFTDVVSYDSAAVEKHLAVEGMADHLAALDAAFAALSEFDTASTEAALRSTADARGVKPASLIHAVRVATTGQSVSPGLFEVLALIGRSEVHARLRSAAELAAHSRS